MSCPAGHALCGGLVDPAGSIRDPVYARGLVIDDDTQEGKASQRAVLCAVDYTSLCDQAFLRWQYMGHEYSPDIVLFGFRVENVYRNLSVVRSIYNPKTGNPFSKPRFLLEGGTLTLVNSPTVPAEEMPDLVASLSGSPLAEYEYYFEEEDYTEYWWLNSRLFAFGLALMDESRVEDSSQSRQEFFEPESEPENQ